MSDDQQPRPETRERPRRGLFVRLLDGVGSVWFGVTMMALIFVYCWLGSAGTAPFYEWFVRQTFEKTEMEWFSWWPLHVLLALFSLSLVLVTVRRIRPTLPNLGVWTVHVGILVLVVGAVVYFARKVEGDMLVYRRVAVLQAGGAPVTLTLRPDAEAVVTGAGERSYHVRVASLDPDYTLRTGADEGKQTYAAQLLVQPFDGDRPGERFVRQVLVGYPQYTEDVLPGRGRAVKLRGEALVDETLTVALRYAPEDRIHLANRAALHVRVPGAPGSETGGSGATVELPLPDLPRYHEYLSDWSDVWNARAAVDGALPDPEPLDLRAPWPEGTPPELAAFDVRVTGFLPFAVLQERVLPGGAGGAPYLQFTVELGGDSFTHALLAGDPEHGAVTIGKDLFDVAFHWVEDQAVLDRWLAPPQPTVALRAPGLDGEHVVTLSELMAAPVAIPGTGYEVHGVRVVPKWTLADGPGRDGTPASMVLVRVRGPAPDRDTAAGDATAGDATAGDATGMDGPTGDEPTGEKDGQRRTFLRAVVYPDASRSRDLEEDGTSHPGLVDEDVAIAIRDLPTPGMKIVAGPVGTHVLMHNLAGEVRHHAARLGEPVSFFEGETQVTLLDVQPSSRRIVKPAVIPRNERDLRAGQGYSLVRVELAHGDTTTEAWLPYSHYAHPSRAGYFPHRLALPGAPPVEVVYSRETRRLPTAVALESFQLETYPGRERERDYISLVRFADEAEAGAGDAGAGGEDAGADGWGPVHEVRSNQPTEHGDWWFFQSTWDPPRPQAGYEGMNFTGLGVGNRHGVAVMLLGGLLTVLGSLFAFYVKPFLLRRQLRRLREEAAAGRAGGRHGGARAPRPGVAAALLVALVALLSFGSDALAAERRVTLSVDRDFATSLDLARFRLLAVLDDGRLKTVDSLARETLKHINASREARRVDPVLLYLDMALAPDHHREAAGIYVRKKVLVQQLVRSLESMIPPAQRGGVIADAELDRIEQTGYVSAAFLDHPYVREVLARLDRDLQRTSKQVQELLRARRLVEPGVLSSLLRLVPPPDGEPLDPWFPPLQAPRVPGIEPGQATAIAAAWQGLAEAWRTRDAARANAALTTLADTLPGVAPALYPSQTRLGWEHWYYRNGKLTITWVVYLFALPLLLMAAVYGFRWARWAGLAFFAAGFGLHTFSIVLRWYLAGRIPNANMFEAILASAWFGGLVALVLEVVLRRRPMKNLPALAAGTYAMTAMMVGHFMPVTLNSDIAPVMPVLDRTIWLYIHTNMIIASYALIFFAAVTALLYLVLRVATRYTAPDGRLTRVWLGGGGSGGGTGGGGCTAGGGGSLAASPALLAAAGGGAGSVILGRTFASGADVSNAGLARTLDGATMIFLEVAFVLLWFGTILGAVWADVSWGRPWGWDPKEVFALNTWLVFLVLLHVRLKVKDKGLWTALLALFGCAVMLFNWIAVNFVIVGLHSYA